MAFGDFFDGMNIFGAKAPSYMSSLLDPAELEKVKNASLMQGLLGTAATYLAQPKNQRYGSALPYLGKAFMGGMQQSQGVYDQATKDYLMAQQIQDFKDKQAEKKAFETLKPNLYTTTPAVTQDVTQAGGYAPAQTEVSPDQMMPNYGLVKQPDVTTQQIVTPAKQEFNQAALEEFLLKNPRNTEARAVLENLKTMKEIGAKGEGVFGKIDPKDYTASSIAKFASTKNYADLTPLPKAENSIFGKIDPKDYTKESLNQFLITKNYTDLKPIISQNANQDFNRGSTLRGEVQSLPEVKAWNVTQPLLFSARQAAKDTTGASDLNMIYALGKALDPNSVVREGELQMAGNTGSFGDKLKGLYKTVSSGGNLDPKVKQELLVQIESRTYAQKKQYDQVKARYSSIAKKSGVNPDDLFFDAIVEPVDISQMRAADNVTLTPAGLNVYNKYKLNGNK